MTNAEMKEKLFTLIHASKSIKNHNDLEIFLNLIYTDEWFERNNSLDWYYSSSSTVYVPPVGLVNRLSCIDEYGFVVEYLNRLDEMITLFGRERMLSKKITDRFHEPHTSYKTFFELRILKNFIQNGANLKLDYIVRRPKDVEALAFMDDFEFYIECKCLSVSEVGLNHLKNESLLKGNNIIIGHKYNRKIVGKLNFQDYCGNEDWDKVFDCFNKTVRTGERSKFKSKLVDLDISLLTSPGVPFREFRSRMRFPVSDRIKNTVIKTKQKLKGKIPCILIVNIPMEIGQASAGETIKNLLENKKNVAISQVILIDWKHTGEEQYYSVFNYVNPINTTKKCINWNRAIKGFEVVDRDLVDFLSHPEGEQ